MRNSFSQGLLALLRHPRFVPVCFVAFIASRLALIVLVETPPPSSDAGWYLQRGLTLASLGEYSERGVPTAYWPVGYPAFLALLFKLAGPSIVVAQLANLALATLSLWLLYRVSGAFLEGDLVPRAAMLLLTAYPNNASYVPLLLSETLFTSLLLLASLLLLSPRTGAGVAAAGLVFGLATLVKAQTILFIPLLAFLAFLDHWSWRSAVRAAGRAGAVCCVALIAVAPWTLRNYNVFGTFILVSTNGGMTLLGGNNSTAVGDYRSDYSDDDPLVAQARFSVEDQVDADRRARALAIGWIAAHPIQFLQLIPKKLFRLWAPDGEGEWGYQDSPFYNAHWRWFRALRFANQAYYVAALVLLPVAVWKLARSRAAPRAFYGVGVVVLVTAVSVVFSGQSRYHFPAMPFIFAYVAWLFVGPGRERIEAGNTPAMPRRGH